MISYETLLVSLLKLAEHSLSLLGKSGLRIHFEWESNLERFLA